MTHGIACCVFLSAVTLGVTGCETLDPDTEIRSVKRICLEQPNLSVCNEKVTVTPGRTDRCKGNPGHMECIHACVKNPVHIWCDNCVANPQHIRCRFRRCIRNPDLPECKDVKVPTLNTNIVFDRIDMETFRHSRIQYYRSRIEKMQNAGDLPQFDVDEVSISYSYKVDVASHTATFMLDLVTTSESDWDAINADWEDVDLAMESMIHEYLELHVRR